MVTTPNTDLDPTPYTQKIAGLLCWHSTFLSEIGTEIHLDSFLAGSGWGPQLSAWLPAELTMEVRNSFLAGSGWGPQLSAWLPAELTTEVQDSFLAAPLLLETYEPWVGRLLTSLVWTAGRQSRNGCTRGGNIDEQPEVSGYLGGQVAYLTCRDGWSPASLAR